MLVNSPQIKKKIKVNLQKIMNIKYHDKPVLYQEKRRFSEYTGQ